MRDRATMFAGVAATALLLACVLSTGCSDDRAAWREAARVTGGEPARGRIELRSYGCSSCHTIPGVPGAHANVGPSLQAVGSRTYLAGELPNNPDNMIRWIRYPHSVEPKTAMPDMGVSEADARDIVAYLYTLR